MNSAQHCQVVAMLGRQWQLLGIASVLGAAATYVGGRLVPEYLILEQRQLWGPLEPFSFIREHFIILSLVQLCFGLCATSCGFGLVRGLRIARHGLLFLSCGALVGSVGFGTLCFLAALDHGGAINRQAATISATYAITSVGFYLTCTILLSSRRVRSPLRRVLNPGGQPNNRMQATAGGLGGDESERRASARRA